jgi:kynurenine 3-monooxygenase
MKNITIIGSGLAGTLMALFLARRDYDVHIFESRSDIRKNSIDYGRSINLALSCRGLTALNALDLMNVIDKIRVPMRARAIHGLNGELQYQAFGRHEEEYINSISRSALNALLLDEAEQNPRIHLHFDTKLLDLDMHRKLLRFETTGGNEWIYAYERLIGADGVGSLVREALKGEGILRADRIFLPHSYKELSISKLHTADMVREHLHLWPRDDFMLLGNPNPDDSITGSLFLANEGEDSFATLTNNENLSAFFKKNFPDVYPLMPDLCEEFFRNHTGSLSTVHCSTWYYKDTCLLIGDAAHGIVPFFGQGMNAAFEDCRILDELLEKYQDDWQQVMPAFFNQRKSNTDAVAKLSMANYREIQSDVRNQQFLLKKAVEHELMERYPDTYISMHVLVMFTNTPYTVAQTHGDLQNAFLDEICNPINQLCEVDWNKVDLMMRVYDKKLTEVL